MKNAAKGRGWRESPGWLVAADVWSCGWSLELWGCWGCCRCCWGEGCWGYRWERSCPDGFLAVSRRSIINWWSGPNWESAEIHFHELPGFMFLQSGLAQSEMHMPHRSITWSSQCWRQTPGTSGGGRPELQWHNNGQTCQPSPCPCWTGMTPNRQAKGKQMGGDRP